MKTIKSHINRTVLKSYLPTVLKSYSPKVLIIFLLSYSPAVLPQMLQFYREDIVFKLDENAVTTDAVYHFCNVGDKELKTQLFYPFPEKVIDQIDTLVIWNVQTNEVIRYRQGHNGVFFGISIGAYGQGAYRVFYQQWLSDKHFKYILTSTANWQRSLEFANYELEAPASIRIDSLSYPTDSSYVRDNTRHYVWKKKDFMPERDFEVFFK